MGDEEGGNNNRGVRLPGKAPKALKEFIACTRDVVVIDTADLGWVDRPQGSPDAPIEISEGEAPNTGTVKIGWGFMSLQLPISIVDGSLVVDVPSMYPDELENGINDWVNRLNSTLRANGKQLDSFSIAGKVVTMRKRAVGAGAAPAAGVAPATSSSGPSPAPGSDTGSKSPPGCLTRVLIGIAALAGALGIGYAVTNGGDDTTDTAVVDSPAAAADDATPTATPSPTPDLPPPTPTPPQVGQATTDDESDEEQVAVDFGTPVPCDYGTVVPEEPLSVAAAGVPLWSDADLHARCSAPATDAYATCLAGGLCDANAEGPYVALGTGVGISHSGVPPLDAVTGEQGASGAGYYVSVSAADIDADWLARITANCGGEILTGESSVNPEGATEVRHPLSFFGPCTTTRLTVLGPDGLSYEYPGAIFGADGSFVVGAAEPTAVPPLFTDEALNVGRLERPPGWGDAATITHNTLSASTPGESECFWFFSAENTDLAVRALDRCSGDRFFVFYGALTNVEVDLVIVEQPIAHGAAWVNSGGAAPPAEADASAFVQPLFANTIYPCGAGMMGYTICPEGEPPVPDGGLVVASIAFTAPLPLEGLEGDSGQAHEVDFSSVGGENYRLEQSADGWALTSGGGETAARAIIRHNALTFVVPQEELPLGGLRYVLRTEADGVVLEQPEVSVTGLFTAPMVEADSEPPAAPAAPDVTGENLSDFYEQLSASVAAGDLGFALDRLHPAVLDAYPGLCADALASFADPDLVIAFVGDGAVGDWTWELPDGQTFTIEDAIEVTLSLSGRGQSGVESTAHVALIDGEYRWFTFCA